MFLDTLVARVSVLNEVALEANRIHRVPPGSSSKGSRMASIKGSVVWWP